MVGVEWLITRTHGGLYISAAQAFFNRADAHAARSESGADSGFRAIDSRTCAGSTWR